MLFFQKKKSEELNSSNKSEGRVAKTDLDYLPLGGLAKYLAWISMVLIVALSLFLSVIIGQNTKDMVIDKQTAFAALLADNLNHQIYRRFTLPTLVGFGRIALRLPYQYERLDMLVQQIVHGLNVHSLRIYDHGQIVSYAVNRDELGREDLASPEVLQAAEKDSPIFNLDSKTSFLTAFFLPSLEENHFVLRTTYPLRVESTVPQDLEEEDAAPLMGVLEFRQDITNDMRELLHFQRSLAALVVVSLLLIFTVMIYFLNRAEKALAARVAERGRLVNELHQHERLASMGRVVAGIAHEIRNPLGIICSSAEFLARRTKDSDAVTSGMLQAILDEGRRLSQTVTDFLDYARPRELKRDLVNIPDIIDQSFTFLKNEVDSKGISVEVHYPEKREEVVVEGDKDLLHRAFYNLIGNAVQAMEFADKKILAVRIERIEAQNSNSLLEIAIIDSGPGFGDKDPACCLDPFYTTKPHGSGLGLPIVNSIIKSHDGSIELANKENSEGPGAVVRVFLKGAVVASRS